MARNRRPFGIGRPFGMAGNDCQTGCLAQARMKIGKTWRPDVGFL